jgi:LacI family transcriptional regulator
MQRTAKRRAFSNPPRVALAFPLSQAHLHSLAQGVADYARSETAWLLTTGGEAATLSVEHLHGWRGDGIVAALVRPSEVRAARDFIRRGVPVVTIAGAIPRPAGIPRVTVENPAVGRMAAAHLLSCGFRRFAFYGLRDVAYSQERLAGFASVLDEAGHPCNVLLSPHTFGKRHPWQDDVARVEKWLAGLEQPLGILAANDYRARLVIEACDRVGLRSPEEVGIVGVDNDRVLCEFSEPQLSSIECDWFRVGQEAARLLHGMMRGSASPHQEQLIVPRGVVARRSTHVTIVENAALLQCVNFVQAHIGEVFGVERLLEAGGVSRRKLEQLFQAELGRSPYQYLCEKRVERARALLPQQPFSRLSDIARQCGFHDLRRLRLVFQRLEKMTPAEYRRQALEARDGGGAVSKNKDTRSRPG